MTAEFQPNIFTDRMPRSGKLPVLNLLTGQKSVFSPRRGDSFHRFPWNLAQPRGTWVHFAEQNFISNCAGGWEGGPKNGKNFHWLVSSRPAAANPLTDFYNYYGLLYAQQPCISVLHLRWFALILLHKAVFVLYHACLELDSVFLCGPPP